MPEPSTFTVPGKQDGSMDKGVAVRSDDLRSFPGTHMAEGSNWLLQATLGAPDTFYDMSAPNKWMNKYNKVCFHSQSLQMLYETNRKFQPSGTVSKPGPHVVHHREKVGFAHATRGFCFLSWTTRNTKDWHFHYFIDLGFHFSLLCL